MDTQLTIFIITTATKDQAEDLASKLVAANLAACVNIIPEITSIYSWDNKINRESEALMIVKSRSELFESIKNFVKINHSYDVPEIIGIPLKDVEENYYRWVISNTKNE